MWGNSFEKPLSYFKSEPVEFALLQSLVQKQKSLNLGPKMPYLHIFMLEFEKKYSRTWNQHHQICLFVKFYEKTKISEFGTKNALLGYCCERIFKKILPNLKLVP